MTIWYTYLLQNVYHNNVSEHMLHLTELSFLSLLLLVRTFKVYSYRTELWLPRGRGVGEGRIGSLGLADAN